MGDKYTRLISTEGSIYLDYPTTCIPHQKGPFSMEIEPPMFYDTTNLTQVWTDRPSGQFQARAHVSLIQQEGFFLLNSYEYTLITEVVWYTEGIG